MEKLTFTDNMKTGIEVIDNQHKTLIEKINLFLDHITKSNTKTLTSELEDMFNFMAEYSKNHFSEEERILEQNSCPTLEPHKMQHQFFLMEATKLKFDLKTHGITPEMVEKTHKLLVEWVRSHILDVDLKLRDYATKNK